MRQRRALSPRSFTILLQNDGLAPAINARCARPVLARGTRWLPLRFTQIDSSRTREHQGTGLGLAIAKEFAELLQGEIQLVSEVGRGSMFSLILPMELNESLAKEAATKLVGRVRERGGQAGNAEPGAAAGQPDPGRRF